MRKLLALLLVVVLVFPLALATLSVISVSAWALDRSFYEDLLGDARLYEVLLSEDLPNYFGRRIVVREVDSLPAEALSRALREVVTPEYMRDQALRIVDDAFDALEGRGDTFELTLDLVPIKAALRGEGGDRFARTLAAELPACAAGQDALAPGGTIIRCVPSNVSVEEAAGLIALALPAYLDQAPDRINLNRNPINLRAEWRGVPYGLVGQAGLNSAIAALVLITGSVWLVAALIGGEDRRERLLWLGWSLLIPAILVFLIGLAINTDFSLGWMRFGLNEARFEGVEYSIAFRQALLDVARDALNTIANGFLAAGGVAGTIALALIVSGFSTPPALAYSPMAAAPAAAAQPAPPTPGNPSTESPEPGA